MTTPEQATSLPLVLYVDDEAPNRHVFVHSFNDEFQIMVADSGRAALEILSQHPVQVIVTDQRMPGMSGMDLLEQVKEAHPQIVRMVVTAYADLEPILRAVNEGLVARYLMKPWDHEELRGALLWGTRVFRSSDEDHVLAARILKTERLATLGTIAASLVHDLRQPLSYMRYNIERLTQLIPAAAVMNKLLQRPESALDIEEQKVLTALAAEYEGIVTEVGAGTNLISDLLKNLASWIAPARTGTRQLPDAVQVIRFAESLSQSLTKTAQVRVVYEGPERLENVAMESAELTQVLVNLISNAAQAIESTGRPGTIVIRAKLEGRKVVLSVSDDGPGMSPEVQKKLGTLFFSTRVGGTGLGLNQCFRLVSRAGGDLQIESTEGKGTTVSLHLMTSET